jgi:WhiB family transcriptional regulator, redox-sensing transcriptional regulator
VGNTPKQREWDTDDGFLFLFESLHPDWHADAACRGMDPAIFYPEVSWATSHAQKICATCPVQGECHEQGMGEQLGIWGGRHPFERQKLRPQRKLEMARG